MALGVHVVQKVIRNQEKSQSRGKTFWNVNHKKIVLKLWLRKYIFYIHI